MHAGDWWPSEIRADVVGRRVLVLGATRGVRASLASAMHAGFHVVAADGSAQAEGLATAHEAHVIQISDPDAVTALASALHVHGIVATTDFAVGAAAVAAERLGLCGITPEAARNATSKARMRERWRAAGLPQPDVAVVRSLAELSDATRALNVPVVLKPAHALGGGSRGVSIACDHAALAPAFAAAQASSPDGTVLVEQCIDARSEHSVELLLHEGEAHVLAIGDKVKTPAPYRVDLAVCYPTALSEVQSRQVGALAAASAAALGLTRGLVHVEVGWTPLGPQLFELGARCGGGATAAPVVPVATGIHEFVEACRLACGLPPSRRTATVNRGVCYRFIAPRRGRHIGADALAAARAMPGVLDVDVWRNETWDGDDTVRSGGDRIGAIVAMGETQNAAWAAAEMALRRLVST